MVDRHEPDVLRRHALEPVHELADQERLLGHEIASEGEREIAGDGQELAGRHVDEVLVEVGDADDRQRVRTEGAWEEWLNFFLEGVISVAGSATVTARSIRDLVDRDRAVVNGFGRGAGSAVRVHELAAQRIVLSAGGTAQRLGLIVSTVNAALARLEAAGILRELTGRRRGRVFAHDAYPTLLQDER